LPGFFNFLFQAQFLESDEHGRGPRNQQTSLILSSRKGPFFGFGKLTPVILFEDSEIGCTETGIVKKLYKKLTVQIVFFNVLEK